jgi:hypothetical protein
MVDFHSDLTVIIADQMINFNHIFIDSADYTAMDRCLYCLDNTGKRIVT